MIAINIVHVLIQIPIMSVGITGLFFIYGISVEKQLIISQLTEAAASLTEPLSILLPEPIKAVLRANFKPPALTPGPDTLQAQNKQLRHKAIIGVAAIIGIFTTLIIAILLIYQLPFPWKSLLEAIIITGCIMFMEFLFFTIITRNYAVIYMPGVFAKILSNITVSG